MITITYYGHSNVLIQNERVKIVIDPFFTNNPLNTVSDIHAIKPDYIIVTHAHSDHIGDTVVIAKHSSALVVSNFEIVNRIRKSGINAHALYISGTMSIPGGWLKFTPAAHGSSFEDGAYGGLAMGVLIHLDGKTIYHAGDTGLTYEFKGLGELYDIDLALLPVGGNYTMDVKDAAVASRWLNARLVVPIHYDTWDLIKLHQEDIEEHLKPVVPVQLIAVGKSFCME
ncbi:MAG: metal-dependent hydrolase [Candidatus Auribacter fodinae]|jgi:L-ascorbate metabolism protein UlaG (beta-lactamase superfamily)|uniref:UPF0173 metal-dependent hydrolase C4541_04525 n=1 Tax=Candidatus Auribacter fodinae TaxID=2093366 RepID=A0A3A4R2K0_9BACT|nr:MAG: metal-dependent hydrolase [Candidatus Auribacter fodinae]